MLNSLRFATSLRVCIPLPLVKNMIHRRIVPALLAALLLLAGAGNSFAQDAPTPAPSTPATAFVQQTATEVLSIVNAASAEGATAERQEALRSSIRGFLSYELLAERTLGDHWDTRSAEQRAAFVALLRDLIETSYAKRLGEGSVAEGDYTIAYTDERERRGRYTVEATVSAGGSTHYLEVKMQPGEADQWLVYDVVTDDVSLEESYAESFESIIADEGWDALLERMQERLTELRAD